MEKNVLVSELQSVFLRSIRDSASLGYNPVRFLRLLHDYGPVITAVHFVMRQRDPEGFETLFISERLDLSIEAIILDEPYRRLFMDEVLEMAEKKLREIGYGTNNLKMFTRQDPSKRRNLDEIRENQHGASKNNCARRARQQEMRFS